MEEAIAEFSEAIRLEPQHALAYANRAIAYTSLGDDAAAQEDLERAVDLGFDRGPLEAAIQRVKEQR